MIPFSSSIRRLLILLVTSAVATGCTKQPSIDQVQNHPVQSADLVIGSYVGDLPCADCGGIRTRIDLFEDKVFFLRESYLESENATEYDDIGTWSFSADDRTLTLHGGREAPLFFRITSASAIRKLDLEGLAINSDLNYDLVRNTGLQALEPQVLMRGMYRYMADAALFTECRTGRRFAVAFEADSISLERAYLDARQSPGEEQLVSVEGRLAYRPAMEGDASVLSLVVDRFVGIWPGETCEQRSTKRDGAPSDGHTPGRLQ